MRLGKQNGAGKKKSTTRSRSRRTEASHPAVAKLAVALREYKEALEQQAATAEILKVISGSPDDVQPVFDAIVKSAVRLVGGYSVAVSRRAGDKLELAAFTSLGKARDDALKSFFPIPIAKRPLIAKAIRTKSLLFGSDTETDPRLAGGSPEIARARGYRSVLYVPLVREETVIGLIHVTRAIPGPFSDHHIQLVKSFADQAVIAIENARLFNETKEALERQAAISEVLRVILGSPTDVKPVLEAVAERAARICDATDARIFLVEGKAFRPVAGFGEVHVDNDPRPLDRGSPSGRAVIDRATQHIEDILAPPADEFPLGRRMAQRPGWRTILSVPLMREDRAFGTIVLRRSEARRFSDKQVSLLQTFADQAAIAIDNVRLFNETKEALERQTATSEVLRVISTSPSDLEPVFEAILSRALGLCEGNIAILWRLDGGLLRFAAHKNASAAGIAYFKEHPLEIGAYNPTPRAALERRVIEEVDVFANPEYRPLIPN